MKLHLSNFIAVTLACLGTVSICHAGGLGIKGGVPMSKASVQNSKFEVGNYQIGLALDLGIMPIGINIDALYGQRKVGFGTDTSILFKEVKIPVVAYVDFFPLRFMGGMYYAQALGKATVEVSNGSFTSDYENLDLKKVDYGAVGGLGILIPAGLGKMILETRYNHGLANISRTTGSVKTKSIDFLIGLMF